MFKMRIFDFLIIQRKLRSRKNRWRSKSVLLFILRINAFKIFVPGVRIF